MEAAAVARALDGCDALLHSAAVYSYDRRDAARVSADTPALARAVLGAALEANVPRVVDTASTVVFTTNADLVTLTTRLAAPGDRTWGDPYVRAKVAAERTGLELEARGLHRVTLHPSLVLGPEDTGPGNSGRTVIALLRNRTTTNARCGWVDVRDVASAAVAAFGAQPGTHAIVSSARCATGSWRHSSTG
jgi:nucleoside-diphosphate-sugar epimerase